MWADTLLADERAHLLRVIVWAGASVLLGTALVAGVRFRGGRTDFLERFGLLTALGGGAELVLGLSALSTLTLRDVAGATRLDRMLWLRIGVECGVILAGFALVLAAWRPSRRAGLMGDAVAMIVQGAALALLDLLLAAQISR